MNPLIRPESAPSKQILRKLVAASLQNFLGPCSLLDPELPFTGAPMLVLEAHGDLVLLSFDPEDGGHALLAGLAAWNDLIANRLWLTRQYPEVAPFLQDQVPRLAVLMPTLLPGADLLVRGSNEVMIFTFRVLAVNGETALLIDAAADSAVNAPSRGQLVRQDKAPAAPGLTEEEEDFLDQIR